MWLLTILLFALTCIYTKIQFKKIHKYYDSLYYEIERIQFKLNEQNQSKEVGNE